MSQDNKKSMVMYQGDGSNRVFSVPFDKGFYGEISVLFVRRGATTFEYDPKTFTLNEDNTLLTWTGDTLNLGDYICIIRNTETGQPYVYQNNQKHIEQALDNLSRQIQEALRMGQNALKVDPTYTIDSSKMNPVDWLQTIIRCKDLSVRGLRFANHVLQYSKEDPEKPEGEKIWYSLLNTDGITNVRERYDVGTNAYFFEYSIDGGASWKSIDANQKHNNLLGRKDEDCHPISAITGLQTGLDKKLDVNQGSENVGRVLKVGTDGNIVASTEAAGLAAVNHDETMEGAGTESSPLGVADGAIGNTQLAQEVKQEIAEKADKATTLAGYGITDGAKTDLSNISSNIDYVVESQEPTSANGYTWYRLYKSGWVEQGGAFSGNSPLSVTLPITMANTAYSCFAGHGRKDGTNWNGNPITLVPETTTILGVYTYGDYQNMTGWWEVKGMSAQGA